MSIECKACGMSIENLICSKCKQELKFDQIDHNGKQISVCVCLSCKGMIKSPQCCGRDMNQKQG